MHLLPTMMMALIMTPMLAASAANASARIEILAEIGQPAPGFPEGYVYWNVENPAVGRSRHVAFTGAADTSISSTDNNTPAIWAGMPEAIAPIIRKNDPILGLPANVLFLDTAVPRTVVTGSGHVGFLARLTGAVSMNVSDLAVLAHVDGMTQLVLRAGVQAPGFPPGVVVNIATLAFAFSDAGMVLTGATSSGQIAMWFWDFDTTTLIAKSGDSAGPDLPGCTFTQFPQLAINDAGVIVFPTLLLGAGCPLTAILARVDGTFELVVATGDPVPGMADTTFDSVGGVFPVRINDAGDVTFSALLRSSNPPATARSIWVARGGGALELLALANEWLPGMPNELLLATFSTQAHSVGDAYSALLARSTTMNSILVGEPRASQPYATLDAAGESQLEVFAQENARPPGFPATWFFDTLLGPAIGGETIVAFGALVADARDVNGTQTIGIWRGTSPADLEQVASEGMTLQVEGETATIQRLIAPAESSTQTGLPSQLADDGTLLVSGSRTGTFADALILLPEPGGIGELVAFAAIGLLRRRRAGR